MNLNFKKKLALTGLVSLMSFVSVSHAHDAGATLGFGNTFAGRATVTCFNDDEGLSDRLEAKIIDRSPPVPGNFVNLQIYKKGTPSQQFIDQNQSSITSDTVSGDANWSPTIVVQGGPGAYEIIVNKTGADARQFQLQYHCMASDGVTHTGTDISVTQFGEDEDCSSGQVPGTVPETVP